MQRKATNDDAGEVLVPVSNTDIRVVVAVHEERFKAVDKALELQASEYERRLDLLNNENVRVAGVLDHSVATGRFDDYVSSQDRALKAALISMTEKNGMFADRTRTEITDLALRIASLEQSSRTFQTISEHDSETKGRNSDHINAFLVGGMGVFISIVVVIVNIMVTHST